MRFGHIELFVTDPEKSRQFYEEVLGFEVTAVQGEGQFIWLSLDTFEILLRPGAKPPQREAYEQAAAGLVLYTSQLSETAQAMARRGLTFADSSREDGCLTFTDPDGHWFQLVNPDDH